MKEKIRIIGAGPAGSAAAIRLAEAGHRVRLFEKSRFPRSKLCGGFLSPESLEDLQALGVLDAVLRSGAVPIRRALIATPSGAVAETHFPRPGLSLSRAVLDDLLVRRAEQAGAELQEATDGLEQTSKEEWTVKAYGRATELQLPRGASYYGIQALFEGLPEITDQVEIDLIPGGYIGLARQSAQAVNVCALVARGRLRSGGADLDLTLAGWAALNTRLAKHLAASQRCSDWQAVGPVKMGMRQLTAPRQLWIGDAAYVVDPFIGEGITMALRSAGLVAEAFHSSGSVEAAYEAAWHRQFDSVLRWGPWLRRLAVNRFTQNLAVFGLRAFPRLLAELTTQTRTRFLAD